jgi:calcineurin-like phosphoesterase family protein
MSNIFIISDTHFGHANILKFTDKSGNLIRPGFDNVDHMDECIADNWNSVVKDSDIVYHLGDVYFEHGHKILPKLKGRKRLVLGNHDNGKASYIQSNFQKVFAWRMFPEFGLLLTHVPVHPGTLEFKVKRNVHGHLHQNLIEDDRYVNVSVECINYTPINIEELRVNGD